MEKISNDEFLKLLNVAIVDKNINNYEFRILVYVFNNDDFLVSNLKNELRISSFNMVSKFMKKLVKEKYIIKESKHIKNEKNQSSYKYFINTEKMNMSINDNILTNSPFMAHWSLYYYFFEKLPTTKKIDKNTNFHQILLLIDFDKYDFTYLKQLIDFVSQSEELKYLYSRPISFRKNIKQIIALYDDQKINL